MQGQEDVVIRDDIRSFLRRQRTKLHGAQVNRIEYLTMAASVGAITSLFLMSGEPSYLSVSLLVGIMAMGVDFAIEHFGITKRAWGYPHGRLSFRGVPLEVPFLFFCCGILVTYATYVLSSYDLGSMIFGEVISGTVLLQVLLLIVAAFFAVQYHRGAIKSLVFWALPLGIALYLSFPQPWILVFSIIPMYLDYYLERRLVRSSNIEYKGYDEDVAINVAISYYPTTLLIMGVVALLLYCLEG